MAVSVYLVSFFLLVFSSLFVTSLQNKTVLTKDMTIQLNTGDYMPMVGFGTYQIQGIELVRKVIDLALASGYRLIDTATSYGNEEEIGKALKDLLPKYNLTRSDIFITTKLRIAFNQGEKAYESLQQSLRKLDCEYIDLYLIHWPGVVGANLTASQLKKSRDDGWKQLVEGKKNGLTKNIGVSNYNVRHLTELMKNNHGVIPAVNQVEWHIKYHPEDLAEYCRNENIVIQGYSSLGGNNNTELLDSSEVKRIAEKLEKTPGQVLLRWVLQQNIPILPKARSKKYIEQNIDLNFNIPEADMNRLKNFNRTKYGWEPDTVA